MSELGVATVDNHRKDKATVRHVQQSYATAGIEPQHETKSVFQASGRVIARSDHSATHPHRFKLRVLSLLTSGNGDSTRTLSSREVTTF